MQTNANAPYQNSSLASTSEYISVSYNVFDQILTNLTDQNFTMITTDGLNIYSSKAACNTTWIESMPDLVFGMNTWSDDVLSSTVVNLTIPASIYML